MSFENWKRRLAGEKVETFLQAQIEDEGYYRKPIAERNPNGNGKWIVYGYVPVAYFADNLTPNVLRGLIGAGDEMRDMTDAEVEGEEIWSWCCRQPITYETYQRVAEGGEPWADGFPSSEKVARANAKQVEGQPKAVATDNAPEPDGKPKEPATLEEFQAAIALALKAAPVEKITSNEAAAIAAGNKNALAEIRLKADKAGRAIYEPLFRQYQTVQKAWAPLPKLCEDQEKKIQREINTWLESERQRLAREQAEAARKIQEEEERNQRAADRAIANGEPEPEPEVTDIVVPSAIVAPIVPTHGTRAVRPELKTFVDITDEAKVAAYFRGNPELLAVLQKLAERATKLGQEVPGTTKRQGYA